MISGAKMATIEKKQVILFYFCGEIWRKFSTISV
jgi:hypothetical protein